MSYNGSGTFVINSSGQPVVTGTTISSTVFNALTADLATGLTNCITKDGQQTITANIPWNSKKITGLGVATTTGDALSYGNNATVNALSGGVFTANTQLQVNFAGNTTQGIIANDASSTNASTFVYFQIAGTTGIGSISNNANAGVLYNTTSDYRVKDIKGEFRFSGAIIDSVPVHLASYKNSGAWRPMFLAHEVAEGGAPFAVTGEKDAIDEEGTPILQQLGSSDPLVAILWAEVRDLRRRLETAGL